MRVPPVFYPEDLKPEIIEDLRDASSAYWGYQDTRAFDDLMLVPQRHKLIKEFVAGRVSPDEIVDALRVWLLKPWHSTRSLSRPRLAAVGQALSKARPIMASFPVDLRVEEADAGTLSRIAKAFNLLDECTGVGPTVASKILAPLRPALVPMWDRNIATAYGFAPNAAGYHQYLKAMQAIARAVRGFW